LFEEEWCTAKISVYIASLSTFFIIKTDLELIMLVTIKLESYIMINNCLIDAVTVSWVVLWYQTLEILQEWAKMKQFLSHCYDKRIATLIMLVSMKSSIIILKTVFRCVIDWVKILAHLMQVMI